MSHKQPYSREYTFPRFMTILGGLGAIIIVVLRAWLIPSQRDIETGLFSTNLVVMLVILFFMLLLGGCAFVLRGGERYEITGKPAMGLAVVSLLSGVTMMIYGVLEFLARLEIISFFTITNEIVGGDEGNLMRIALHWLQPTFCLLGGVALLRLGLLLASENSTRRGMVQWGMLIPVLWMWVVLANYEMSYASMVRLSDGFFSLGMYVMEMLFLLFFARYVSGVGKVGHVTLMLFSCGATLLVLSAPVVRVIMYLRQDSEAFVAAGAAGPLDFAIGLLALTVSITLCQSLPSLSADTSDNGGESEESKVDLIVGFDEVDAE